MPYISDFARGKTDSRFSPPSPSSYFKIDPVFDEGGFDGLQGSGDYYDALRDRQITLDHYGYALTDAERARIEEPRGRGWMEKAQRLLEIPGSLVTVTGSELAKSILPNFGIGAAPRSKADLLPTLGAIATLDDDRILKELPYLDTDGDGKPEISTAALVRGGELNPQTAVGRAALATVGFSIDMAADPLNWVGFGTLGVGKHAATAAAKGAVTRATREAAEALIKGSVDDVADPFVRRLVSKIDDGSRELRDELFESAKASKSLDLGRDLTDQELIDMRKLLDDEVFKHEVNQALLLEGREAAYNTADDVFSARSAFDDDTIKLLDERLKDSDAIVRGDFNRIGQLVQNKQFRTLQAEFPELVKSKLLPSFASGGLTLTVPFARQASGGINLGMRTNRAVSAPVRSVIGKVWDVLPDNLVVKQGVESFWKRRGVEVASGRVAGKGEAWELAAAQGKAKRALASLGADNSPEELRQALLHISTVAKEQGDEVEEAFRIFGSVLDGETKVDDLLADPSLFSAETAQAIADAHGQADAVLKTIHAALSSFDEGMGFIEDYFPLVASDHMVKLLDTMGAHSKAVPLVEIEAAAAAMSDPAAAARLRVGGQILADWLASAQSARAVSGVGAVVDHSRYMNSRLMGQSIFSAFGDPDLTLTNKKKLVEFLTGGGITDQGKVGWSSRTTINDAVNDALEFMESKGLLKLPKERIDPFSMDVPAVLESYVKATQRVLHFKTFVQASEQMGLVQALPEAIEVGLTLAKQVTKFNDEGLTELMRVYRKFLDNNRTKVVHLTEDVAIGPHVYKIPKGMLDDPEVAAAVGKAQEAWQSASRQMAAHREGAEKHVRALVEVGGIPKEFAEDFAVLNSDKAMGDLVAQLWASNSERLAQLRSAAHEMAGRRSPEEAARLLKELESTAETWGSQIRTSIRDMRDQWADSFGFERYKTEGSFDLTETFVDPKDGATKTRSAAIADLMDTSIRDEIVARVGARLSPTQRARLAAAPPAEAVATALDMLKLSAGEIEDQGVLKAWDELANLVTVSDLTFRDLLDHAGPVETIRVVEHLAGFATPPVVNDELFDIVSDMTMEFTRRPFQPKTVAKGKVGDLEAIADEWAVSPSVDVLTDGAAETRSAGVTATFNRLREQTEEQIRFLEMNGFEFEIWRNADTSPYGSVDELAAAIPEKHVFVEVGKTQAAPPLLAPVELGSGLSVPFIDAFDVLHRVVGHGVYGYGDDAVGITNAWLAHMQMFDEDVLEAYTTLTRMRRIAELRDGPQPVKMFLADPRVASPFAGPAHRGAEAVGESIEGVLEGGAGYSAGLPENLDDPALARLNRAANDASGEVPFKKGARGESAKQTRERIDQEILDEERKFRIIAERTDYARARQLVASVDHKLRHLRKVEGEMPVSVAIGDGFLVTLRNGRQHEFASREDALAWWYSQRQKWWEARERTVGGDIPANPELSPTKRADIERMKAEEAGGLPVEDDLAGPTLDGDEIVSEEDFISGLDDEVYNAITPEVSDAFELDRDLGFDFSAVEGEDPAMRSAFDDVARQDEKGLVDPTLPPSQRISTRMDRLDDEELTPENLAAIYDTGPEGPGLVERESASYKPGPTRDSREVVPTPKSASAGRIYRRADGKYGVFAGLEEMEAEWTRLSARTERAREALAAAYDEMASALDSAGLDLKELVQGSPPGLRETGLAHPLFNDPAWRRLVEAAHAKRGVADAAAQADGTVHGWVDSIESLIDGQGVQSLADTLDDGAFEGVGAGLVAAFRNGDFQAVAENEVAMRALMERSGLESDRLLIEPLGDGEFSVRWGTQSERVIPEMSRVRPALLEALAAEGVHGLDAEPIRRLILEAKARNLRIPELGHMLDTAGPKGNLVVEVEDFFYFHELLPKISLWKRSGRGELEAEMASASLVRVLDELEPLIASKGRVAAANLESVWEANQADIAKFLTAKDFRRLQGLVELAPLSGRATARLRMLTSNSLRKMADDTTAAMRVVEDLVNDIYQSVSPRVSEHYAEAIEASEYLAVRQAGMLGEGRGNVFAADRPSAGFEPHYNQNIIDPKEQADFEHRMNELNEAAKDVGRSLKRLMKDRALQGERAEFFDFAMAELADQLPAGESLEEWIEKRIKHLGRGVDSTRTGVAIKPGFTDQSQFGINARELDGKVIDEHIGLVLESMAAHSAALWSPLGVRLLAEQVRGIERYWKGATTVARPTFTLRNIMGGAWNGMIADVGLRDYAWVGEKALRVRRALSNGDTWDQALKFLDPDDAEVFRAAKRMGIFETEYTADFLPNGNLSKSRSVKPWSEDFFLFDMGGKFMQSSEDFMRLAAFRRWYQAGDEGSAMLAREMVNAVHFDYANLTNLETKIKRLVPFFVWTRRNLPLQVRTMFERPGMINRYTSLQQNVEAAFNDPGEDGWNLPIPSWMGGQAAALGSVLEHDDDAWTRMIFAPDLPIKDLEQFVESWSGGSTDGPVLGAIEWASQSLTPLVKIPMDIWDRKDYSDVPAPLGLAQAMEILEVFGVDASTQDIESGDTYVANWMRSMYETAVPFQREWLETFGVFQDDDRRAARLGVSNADDASVADKVRASALSIGRAFGIRGETKEDVAQEQFNLEETIQGILEHAEAEGRIIRDAEGNRLKRQDLARMLGDPFEGASGGSLNGMRVIDGDTFETADGETIRIAYSNTPEREMEGFSEATDYLRLALGQGADVRIERKGYDEFGRTIAEVYVNGQNISDAVLGAGHGNYVPSVHRFPAVP